MADFQIEQKLLSEMLGIAAKIPNARNVIQILECVRLRFNGSDVSVDATDMESWVSLSTPGFEAAGCVTAIVPCKQFHSIIAAIKDQTITISVTEKKLTVKTETSRYNFGLLPNEDWPALPEQKRGDPITIKARDFASGMAFVIPSMAVNDHRYFLCGICITKTERAGAIRLMSADGHRASTATLEVGGKPQFPNNGIIIPREHVQIIGDLIGKTGAETELLLSMTEQRSALEFTSDYRVTLTGRLIEGQFPDLDRLIPYDREHFSVTMPREAVMNALRRLETMSDRDKEKGSPGVAMRFANGQLNLSIKGKLGDANENFPSTVISGEGEAIIHVGISVIVPLLSVLKGNDVVMMFQNGNADAAVILSETDVEITPDSTGFSIFMPMKG